MNITINGEALEIEAEASVARLLEVREVKMPDMLTVHVNGTIVDQKTYDETMLKEGDEVEFLFFMGGGG